MLDWYVIGPFDNSGRSGHQQKFAPEDQQPFSLDQQVLGKLPNEMLSWHQLIHAQSPRGALISLDDLLDPNDQVTGVCNYLGSSDSFARCSVTSW